jgi:hypothetical protein
VHVAAYIEQLQKARSAPTAKLRLAALRHLFDWMVIGQIMPVNPAAAATALCRRSVAYYCSAAYTNLKVSERARTVPEISKRSLSLKKPPLRGLRS